MTDHAAPPAPDNPAGGPPIRKAAFAFILVTVLLDVASLGVIIPVWPALITKFTGTTVGAGWWIGISGTAWALMQFFFQPLAGALSDRFGRRPVILASNLGTGFDYLVMAFAPSLWFLLVGRLVSGVTSASIATAFAYIADVTEPSKRAARFGLLGAVFGLGFMLGPGAGALLGDARNLIAIPGTDWVLQGGAHVPFIVAGALSLLNFAYGWFVLPESLPEGRRDRFSWRRANPLGAFQLLKSHVDLLPLATVLLMAQFGHYVLQTVFTLYAFGRYGFRENEIGLTMIAIGVCAMVVQGALVGPIVKLLGERRSIVVGLLCGATGFAIYGLAPTWQIFMIGVPIMSFWGIAGPSTQSLMSRRVAPQEQGKLQGANQGLQSVAGIFAPALYGSVYALFNDQLKGLGMPGFPFFVAGAFLLTGMLIAVWAARDAGRREAAEVAQP
ncbi:MAG: TCR/Tet family MFS transporter [Caulobacteraceae bacterium]|nr:TCR/Tet family MFS transporter [Caulobacteraceae bacterium]